MRERIYFDLRKEDEGTKEKIGEILRLCNEKSKGRPVDLNMIISFSLSLIKEGHIEEIQKQSLSEWDLINDEWEKYKAKTGEKITLQNFLVKKLKIKSGLQ